MIRPLTQSQRTLSSVLSILSASTELSGSDLEKIAVTGISTSSNDVEPGDLFCAFAGAKVHGATFAKPRYNETPCTLSRLQEEGQLFACHSVTV